eukprot:GFUD01127975.1.p1 GENE.GFUD01127975.1~~GFUD01127975.1.p1  ORF type:complete len:471 (-),score=133.53 GFUD01127975.1:170-1582(-)
MPSPAHLPPSPVLTWTTSEVRSWLTQLGMARYARLLCDQHRVDGPALLMLQEEDFRQPPLRLDVLGDIKHLAYHLSALRYDLQCSDLKVKYCLAQSPGSVLAPTSAGDSSPLVRTHSLASTSSDDSSYGREPPTQPGQLGGLARPLVCTSCQAVIQIPKSNLATKLNPERWKTAVAIMYALSVSWLTALTMTVVHDRVPDMNKYPPLPDIILDNVPHIPWAFEMTEVTGMTLLSIWLLVMLFHKHRFIIARRFFSIAGTIFLLRCITMLITSLSVPGVHLDCKPRPYGTWANRLYNAYIIWSGAGMSLQGVRTCGDYMFSGHTVSLTLLNFFITEYTSRRIYFLHTFTWVLSCFGVFFILAAHEHYSIDVFVAFYISSRLFLYYHTLVNNRAVTKYQESFDAKRTWFYFPLFSFFEQNIDGRIPNEFQLPLSPEDVKNGCQWIVNLYQSTLKAVGSNREVEKQERKKKRR